MNPPRLATWLLQRGVSGPRRESLAGDLVEQLHRGRSRAWYWRQVVKAILGSAVHDVRDHKGLAVGAVVGSYVLIGLWAFCAKRAYNAAGLMVWNWTVAHGWDTARIWWFGRPQFPQPPIFVMSWISPVMTGWVIARLDRRHSLALVLTCAAFFGLLPFAGMLWTLGPPNFLRLMTWLPVPRVPFIVRAMGPLNLIRTPVCMLLGGVWGSRPNHDSPDEHRSQLAIDRERGPN